MTVQETTCRKQQVQRNTKADSKQTNNNISIREGTQFNVYPSIYYAYGSTPATHGITFVPDSFSLDSTKLDLKKQLEYYFSRQNLANDTYLASQMDSEQYVPIALIAGFKRVREQTSDLEYITNLLRSSSAVIVDETGTRVKPNITVQRSTVILRDLPESTLEEVEDLLKELNSPQIKSVKQDIGSMWYVTLESEEDAVKLLFSIKGKTFKGKPIAARIKSEPTFKPRSTTITIASAATVEPLQSVPPTQLYVYYNADPLQQLPQQLRQHYHQKRIYHHKTSYQNNHQNNQHQHIQHSKQQQQYIQHKNGFDIKKNHQNKINNTNRYENHHHQKYNRHNNIKNQPNHESLTNNVANTSINNNKKRQNHDYSSSSNNDNDNKSSHINTGDNNQNNNNNAHANSNTKNTNIGTNSNSTSNSKNNNNSIDKNNDNSTSKKHNQNNKQGNKQHKKRIRQDRKKSGKQAELMQSCFPPLPNQKVSTVESITVDPVNQEKPAVQKQEPMSKSFSYAEMLKKKE